MVAYLVMNILEKLLVKLTQPKSHNLLLSAIINIHPDSRVEVDIKTGPALPDESVVTTLCLLVMYQAVNIRWNLTTEPEIIQQSYGEMMTDILAYWPKFHIKEFGDFASTLPFIQQVSETNLTYHMPWAVGQGETIELKLAQKNDKILHLFDYYPGMPGRGPRGLALNFVLHYIYLVDFTLFVLDGFTCEKLAQNLSELWLVYLSVPFDANQQINRSRLYQVAFDILLRENAPVDTDEVSTQAEAIENEEYRAYSLDPDRPPSSL
jgi:hypothetical protein